MQRFASLRTPLASATSVVLPEAHACGGGYGYARADSALIRLHAHEVHLNKVVAIAAVLKEPVKSICTHIAVPFAAEPVLHDDVEKSIVVIIRPGSDLVQVKGVIVLERQTVLGGPVSKCSVSVVVVEKIGISDSLRVAPGFVTNKSRNPSLS